MNMKFRFPASLVLALALLLTGGALSYAQAFSDGQPVSECQERIAGLRAATTSVVIEGRNADKDRATLIGKLDEAALKLAQGKPADALLKLADFRTKIEQLAAAGRLSSDSAASLLAGADAAIACISPR